MQSAVGVILCFLRLPSRLRRPAYNHERPLTLLGHYGPSSAPRWLYLGGAIAAERTTVLTDLEITTLVDARGDTRDFEAPFRSQLCSGLVQLQSTIAGVLVDISRRLNNMTHLHHTRIRPCCIAM